MGKFYKISSIISLNLSLEDKANIKRGGLLCDHYGSRGGEEKKANNK